MIPKLELEILISSKSKKLRSLISSNSLNREETEKLIDRNMFLNEIIIHNLDTRNFALDKILEKLERKPDKVLSRILRLNQKLLIDCFPDLKNKSLAHQKIKEFKSYHRSFHRRFSNYCFCHEFISSLEEDSRREIEKILRKKYKVELRVFLDRNSSPYVQIFNVRSNQLEMTTEKNKEINGIIRESLDIEYLKYFKYACIYDNETRPYV